MTKRAISLQDFSAALFVTLLGTFAAWEASGYPFGSLRSIDSGFFPTVLGLIAVAVGLAMFWEAAMRRSDGTADGETDTADLRAILAVAAALLAFALLIDRAGLVPAIFACVMIASFAERKARLLGTVVLAAVLIVLCVAVFVLALKLPMRIFIW